MNNQLDPQVVDLAKSIRQSESGGNFNAQGKSGENGGYQFTPDTWNATAPKYGITSSLKDATPEQQNAVAYNRIKSWKDQGNDVTQIASMWNAGEAEPNAYTGKFGTTTKTHKAGDSSVGVNSFGAKYDVPAYVKSVASAYLSLKNGRQVQSDPKNPSSVISPQFPLTSKTNDSSVGNSGQDNSNADKKSNGLIGQLGSRASDIGGAVEDTYSGKINPLTGALRAVGDVAGGINDVAGSLFTNTIGRIPVVKSLMSSIGGTVSGAMNSPIGKSIADSYHKFASAHPEIASDLNAGYNIVSVIPLLTGIGAIGDATASAMARSAIQKGISSSLEQAGVEGAETVTKTLIDEGAATPKIVKGNGFNTLDFTKPKSILTKSLAKAQGELDSLNDASAPLKEGGGFDQYSKSITDAEAKVKSLQDAISAVDKIHGSTIKKGIISKGISLVKKGAMLGLKYGAKEAGLGAGIGIGETLYKHFTQ